MSAPWAALPDLASRTLGGGVVAANDEFFGAADNLVLPELPRYTPSTFGPKGQVYDGWETRRRREPGHDWAIVRLGAPGIVRGVVVDTAFFTGNFPPEAAVEACALPGYPGPAALAETTWWPLVPRSGLRGDTRNEFDVDCPHRFTHVRLRIFPDGGVARLRVHGEVVPDPALLPGRTWDLAALANGGQVVGCSDGFYGPPDNLLAPGLAGTMGQGWETTRRRDGGNDWVVVRLGARGRLRLAELDTTHFKGNAPGAASLRGADCGADAGGDIAAGEPEPDAWFDLLPRTTLQPDTCHRFPIPAARPVTHVRLDAFPDGGMARLRLYGKVSRATRAALASRLVATQPSGHG